MQRGLNAEKILATAGRLQQRITERFPGSSLSHVGAELHTIAKESVIRSAAIRQPKILLRATIAVLVLGIIAVLVGIVFTLRVNFGAADKATELVDFMQFLEASLGSLVFIGAAILFLVTLEQRYKRRRALNAIHELRALAHIVDMHQLTKDPDRVLRGPKTPSSPQRTMTPFQLCRYLDYCTELLSMISKIGAIYVQDFPDESALEAVDQVESLTNGLSRQIWQKIMILDRVSDPSDIAVASIQAKLADQTGPVGETQAPR